MIRVQVTSHIVGKKGLSGEYQLSSGVTILDLVHLLQIKWDHEALAVVNEQIVEQDYVLQDADHVYFLTPLVGG